MSPDVRENIRGFLCGEINSIKQLTTVVNCSILFVTRGDHMNLIINNSSMEPIYEQIIRQIKGNIIEEKLLEGTMLPSVRNLSKELKISALTVKKAYDQLEEQGFIVTVHGKGSFVSANSQNFVQEEQRKAVEKQLEEAIRCAKHCGMTKDDLTTVFELILEEW